MPTATHRRSRARAMAVPPPSTPRPSVAIRSSHCSIAAWTPTSRASTRRATCWCWTPRRNSSGRCRAPARAATHRVAEHGRRQVDSDTFWSALALVLVIEGLLPFLSPGGWRRGFGQLMQLRDGQLRFFGLCSILLGLILLWLLG